MFSLVLVPILIAQLDSADWRQREAAMRQLAVTRSAAPLITHALAGKVSVEQRWRLEWVQQAQQEWALREQRELMQKREYCYLVQVGGKNCFLAEGGEFISGAVALIKAARFPSRAAALEAIEKSDRRDELRVLRVPKKPSSNP
jgi:hypothetical protein